MLLTWLASHFLEIIALITGLLYIILSIRRNILCWPFGILSSGLYVYVVYRSGIFADMVLYGYYILIGFYGWYHWLYGNNNTGKKELRIKKTGLKAGILLIVSTSVLFILISYFLKNFTTSNVPYWDAFTTALSITATWMLTQKMIEHWLVWVVVDSVTMGLYSYKGLYPTILLYFVYTVLAVVGYVDWQREWKKQEIPAA